MKKSLILLLILGSILIYLIYDSFQVKFESPKKNTLNRNIKYYDNNINIDRVLSDKLRKSGTLEEEQVNSMKINFYKVNK